MKKILFCFISIFLTTLLFACNPLIDDHKESNNNNESNSIEPNRKNDNHENEDNSTEMVDEETFIFIGVIEEINHNKALVSIEEGEIQLSGSLVGVNLTVASDTTFKVGDKVKVGFDGIIRETHPLQINTVFVELVE